ncbi:MAG TPA: ribosome maturation factor RimM [Candidatus Acidoferrum sp.]|nr:ribosome maturation factor RimM [Candidatus Acidoferrum sp.]
MPPLPRTPLSEANAGRIAGVFGLRGELKVDPSRIGDDALDVGLALRATLRDGTSRTLRVRALRRHKGRPLVSFEGIDDATAAEALIGATLTVDRDAVALAADEYFDDDLVGCTLVDPAGNIVGDVVGVEHYPAQDFLLVGPRRAMVPLVRAFVQRVDLAARRIAVDLPPGLLDPAQADEA